jgi:hypothetical protein
MSEELKQNLTRRDTWVRGFFIVLFALCYSLAEFVLAAVVVFQFLSSVVTGRVNERLLVFGRGLSAYAWQIWMYLTYNNDDKPFPFGPWPHDAERDAAGVTHILPHP